MFKNLKTAEENKKLTVKKRVIRNDNYILEVAEDIEKEIEKAVNDGNSSIKYSFLNVEGSYATIKKKLEDHGYQVKELDRETYFDIVGIEISWES